MAALLVDEGIGQDLVRHLRTQGLRVFHALEYLPKGAEDSLIFLEAQQRHLTIFTMRKFAPFPTGKRGKGDTRR